MQQDRARDANVLWLDEAEGANFPPLLEDKQVDVAIVGGGVAGLHSALALSNSGLSVAVLEARRIGRQATGRSTAKVTSQHGLRYAGLARDFGRDRARLYAKENEKAVAVVADLCERIGDSARFERQDALVYAADRRETEALEREAEAAREAGIEATVERGAETPVEAAAWLKFPRQAQIDPFGYLQGLARLVAEQADIHEHSRVDSVEHGDPCVLKVNGRTMTAGRVVVATQMPIVSEGLFFTKAFPFAHPVAAAPLAAGVSVDGMFISAGTPSRSFRTAVRGGTTYLVAVGSEYKPGEPEEQRQSIDGLRAFLRQHFGIEEPSHLWTNEDFRPMDGAAFIGPADTSHSNILVATGFAAWGITQGVVAGEILAASILGQEHPAASLYDATRVKPLVGGMEFLKENAKAGAHLAGDRLLGRKTMELDDIPPGQGGVVASNGDLLAVCRSEAGATTALSAICTHMGCVVDWNSTDRTWDCPCHGSRFDEEGVVLAGPATKALEPRRLRDSGDGEE